MKLLCRLFKRALTCFIQLNTTPKKKVSQQIGSFDIDPERREHITFQAFKVGLCLSRIHRFPQIMGSEVQRNGKGS